MQSTTPWRLPSKFREFSFFIEFGFLASDNPGLLYRNAVTEIHGTDSYIEITIPYFQEHPTLPGTADITTSLVPDPATPLAINFDVLAKDAVVTYSGTPVAPGDTFSFHDGTNPIDRIFVIEKTDPLTGDYDSRSYTISVKKAIYPKVALIDHPTFLPAGPPNAAAAIDVYFVDELGNLIPQTGASDPIDSLGITDELGLDDGDGLDEESFDKKIQVDFDTWQVNPDTAEHVIADAKLYGKGEYRIVVPPSWDNFTFVDADGYESRRDSNTSFRTIWDPDAIYMATWGSSLASGLDKSNPISTLAEALVAAGPSGASRFEIKVAEGTYDLGAGVTIDSDVSIYGGYSNDFSTRWNMEDPDIREAHAPIFSGDPLPGGGTGTVNGVLTYNPVGVISPTSILDGVIVFAAESTNSNFTAAVVLTGLSSPEIRNGAFVGGGGGTYAAFGLALQNCTGTPVLRNNIIIAAEGNINGANAGLLSNASGTFLAIGNFIRGSRTTTDSSFGILLINAMAELHGNEIRSGQAGIESVGLSAKTSGYLRATGNKIRSNAAIVSSHGISLELMTGTSHIYNNVIVSGDSDITTGIRTINIGGEVFEIINNAILTGTGAGQNSGLYVENAPPASMNFVNNLVDSESGNLIGVETSTVPVSVNVLGSLNFLIYNNAFDDKSGGVDMQITGVTAPLFTTVEVQNETPGANNVYGNIEKDFTFDANSWITSGLDANIAYGGADGNAFATELAPFFLQNDQRERPRIMDFVNSGWSIGPIEYNQNEIQYPAVVHLAEGPMDLDANDGPGSDKYVLGTSDYPFEGFGTAYTEASTRPVGTELHIAKGDYDAGNMTLSTDMRILGGYNDTFTARNYSTNATELFSTTPGLLYLDSVSTDFVLEGFVLRSDFGGNADLITVQNWATPTIRHNRFESSAANTGFTALRTISGANPRIYDNTFIGGSASGNTTAVVFEGTPTGSTGEFYNNVIFGGSPTTGDAIMIEVTGNAWPYVHDNVMTGEIPTIGDAIGVSFTSNTAGNISRFERNTIFSGDSPTSNTTGFIISGVGANPELRANTISAGIAPGSNATTVDVGNNAAPYLVDNQIFSGTSSDIVGISLNGTGFMIVEDNDIHLANTNPGGFVYGLQVSNAGPELNRNNVISGGVATELVGYRLLSADGTRMVDNNVDLGVSDVAIGMYAQNTNAIDVENLRVTGGTVTVNVHGMYLSNANGRISRSTIDIDGVNPGITSKGVYAVNSSNLDLLDNTISGGVGSDSYGIHLETSNNIRVVGNTIFGGEASDNSRGIMIETTNGAKIVNNLIHGGARVNGQIRGVEISGGDNQVSLYNNTIFAGQSNSTRSVAVHTTLNAQPRVVNNLIITGSGIPIAESFGFWQESALLPSQFLNNIIIGVDPGAIPYRDDAGGDWMDGPALDGYFAIGLPDYGFNNLDINQQPSVYLQRFTSDGGKSEFLSDNWRLGASGGFDAVSGGTDLSGDPVFFFDYDRTGNPRGAWSVGAYEY